MLIAETPRIFLRHFSLDDLDELAPIMAKPEMHRYSYRGPLSRDETRAMLERFLKRYERDGTGPYAMTLKETNRLIGFAGLPVQPIDGRNETEVGYGIDPHYQGRGLATEGACAARDYAFDQLGLARVISIIKEENTASIGVAERMGMRFEKRALFWGAPVLVYAISREDWERLPR